MAIHKHKELAFFTQMLSYCCSRLNQLLLDFFNLDDLQFIHSPMRLYKSSDQCGSALGF